MPFPVEDQHPLKQGLKQLNGKKLEARYLGVEDQHPLKQGLKPPLQAPYDPAKYSRRPTSTKTRIETP